MNILQKLVHALSPVLFKAAQNIHTLLSKQGQWRSIREARPVRADGTPLPWYTYPAIEYLVRFDWSTSRIFEYGAGFSSLFWAHRAKLVVSVDRDAEWVRRLESQAGSNLRLFFRAGRADYVGAIREPGTKFDLVVIDGHWRHDCVAPGMECLEKRGMVLLDNSDMFVRVAERLRDEGFFQIDFSGFGPVNNYAWTTSLFVRADVGIRRDADPHPIAGLGVTVEPEDEP
jgi:hypothetical protein